MKHLLAILLTIFLLSACTSFPDIPTGSDKPQPLNPNGPTPIIVPNPPNTDNIDPRPGDEALQRAGVYFDSIDLLVMESYPLQFSLALTGNLPTPCHQLRVSVAPPDDGNRIFVDVYSVVTSDGLCTEVLQPFSKNVPLGSFPSGHYTLWVNGEMISRFDA